MIRLKDIKFTYKNRRYNLHFNNLPIIQVKGEGTTGRSMFFSDFESVSRVDKRYKNNLLINFKNSDMASLITFPCSYDFVVIDNADIILNDELCEIIEKNLFDNPKTHWVIIGRDYFPCVLSMKCIGNLRVEKKGDVFCFSIDYTKKWV